MLLLGRHYNADEEDDDDDDDDVKSTSHEKLKPFDKQKDYYSILGVDRSASAKELKDSYKKQALLCHPDKLHTSDLDKKKETSHGRDTSTDKFQQLVEAFTILSHEPTRKAYDKLLDAEQANGKYFGAHGKKYVLNKNEKMTKVIKTLGEKKTIIIHSLTNSIVMYLYKINNLFKLNGKIIEY